MIETIPSVPTLVDRMRERIRREGPITFCDWMKMALYDSCEGYYRRADQIKWGREGDYRTSPERSSLFAATFGSYFARLYDQLGRPRHWTIVEVGAGDGRFAHDVLQALQNSFPQVFSATRYVIDEVSSYSRSCARECLQHFSDRVEFRMLDEVAVDPGIVFSNELLDAFPVHRVSMQEGRLRELYVDLVENSDFRWRLGAPSTPRLDQYFEQGKIQLSEGQVAEVSLAIEDWLHKVAGRLRRGYLVTVDYGTNAEELYTSAGRQQGTLRSFKRHQIVDDVLAHPGEQDLTSTVNWTYVKTAGEKFGLEVVKFERQDKFLLGAGLLTQLECESQKCRNEVENLCLTTAAREMILPEGMATSFQVLVQKKISLSA